MEHIFGPLVKQPHESFVSGLANRLYRQTSKAIAVTMAAPCGTIVYGSPS